MRFAIGRVRVRPAANSSLTTICGPSGDRSGRGTWTTDRTHGLNRRHDRRDWRSGLDRIVSKDAIAQPTRFGDVRYRSMSAFGGKADRLDVGCKATAVNQRKHKADMARSRSGMSAFGGTADIAQTSENIRL